jgi:hypothetical protein
MKLWKGAKKGKAKAPPKKAKSHTQAFPAMMDQTIAAQQAVRARNDWRAQIRANDAKAQAFLRQHLFAQPNRF